MKLTEPGPGTAAALVEMALACVEDGTIDDPDPPAVLRTIGGRPQAAGSGQRQPTDVLRAELLPKAEGLVLAEVDLGPGVVGLYLTREPVNDRRLVWIGALERRIHRLAVKATRRLLRFVTTPVVLWQPPALGRARG